MHKLIPLVVLATGCLGSEEAAKVSLPVGTSSGAIAAATSDLGYTVQVDQMRVAVTTVQFTIEGEEHSGVTAKDATNVIALPHPGHSAGGEVTGELLGNHVFVWNASGAPALGNGTLIVGDYFGANFTFRAAGAADGLAAGDRLLGHTFHLTGTVAKDGTTKPFEAVLDVETDAAIIGALFDHPVTESSTETLAFVFAPTDPVEGDTAFDGVDFFTLPETAGTLLLEPGSSAHNILRRTLGTHDLYAVVAQ